MIEQTKKLAHELRLLGLLESCARRCTEAEVSGLMPAEFLKLVLEDERIYRKNRVAKTLETKAKFRHQACFEDWDSSYDRGVSKAKLKDLSQLSFLYNREHLLLIGGTGEGKSHLAIALGRRICAAGHGVMFISVSFFFEEALAAKASGKYLYWVKTCAQKEVIILDDFALRKYTHEESMVLIDVLEEHQKKGVLIITSQVETSGWKSLFQDPVSCEAIIDRITQPSQTVILKGGSYRSKIGSKNDGILALKSRNG
jgi:DNA replication protein DnaC